MNSRALALLILAWFLMSLPPLLTRESFILRLLVLGMIFAILAGSWNLIGGYAGQISLGHAAFFGVGAYTSALLILWYGAPSAITVPFGGAVAACLAALVAIPFFRWRGDVFAFGTLAFAETLRMIVGGWSDVGGSVGLTITCVQLDVSSNYYLTLFSAIAVMLLLVFLVDSRFGRALTTIRNDELVANSVGIPVLEYKSLALVASSFMAGTAGSLYALNILFVSPALFGVTWTASSILIAIVGGTATIFGPVLMAFVYVFLQVYFLASFPTLNQVLYGSLLIAMILILPRGLTGLWHRFAGSFKG